MVSCDHDDKARLGVVSSMGPGGALFPILVLCPGGLLGHGE